MIYGRTYSTKGNRYGKLFANANGGWILDFTMPRDGTGSLGGLIVVHAVPAAFAEKNAAICLQVAN